MEFFFTAQQCKDAVNILEKAKKHLCMQQELEAKALRLEAAK